MFVNLVFVFDKMCYIGFSNFMGEVVFMVLVGKMYEVDVDGIEVFKMVIVLDQFGLSMMEVVFYEKISVCEMVKGDIIIQLMIMQIMGMFLYVLFIFIVVNFEGQLLEREIVFMKVIIGKCVYQVVMNEKGVVLFLLQKGIDYVVNFRYEQNVYFVEVLFLVGFYIVLVICWYCGLVEIEVMFVVQVVEMCWIEEEWKQQEVELVW